jgi:hypothetical protein
MRARHVELPATDELSAFLLALAACFWFVGDTRTAAVVGAVGVLSCLYGIVTGG